MHTETILRFQIQRHDELPQTHKDALLARGIDPDTRWSLIYSFNNGKDAGEALQELNDEAESWETYRLVDAGEAQEVEASDRF